jgi:hypothetical protein
LTIEEALFQLLASAPRLAAITDGRVYPDTLPQEATLPAVVFSVISDIPDTAHDGDSGHATAVVQADMWADSRMTCAAMKNAIRLDLNGTRHEVGDWKLTAVLTNTVPDYSPDLRLKRYITEFRVQSWGGLDG